jgi:hypothetical protein
MALTFSLLFCYAFCLYIAYRASKYAEEICPRKQKPELDLSELTIDDFINQ